MWRRGLLSDEVYTGDLAFGALLKQYTPWVHDGYLTYGRWVKDDRPLLTHPWCMLLLR
jgi:hypothetical protein